MCSKKKFRSDYPRPLANRLWLRWFPALEPFPVAPALAVAFLLAAGCRAVPLLRLPPRPRPCLFPAALTAIPLARLPRWKPLLTPLQQTPPPPRPASPPSSRLLFAMACRTLGRAHGRSRLPEAPALEGNATPLRGAVTSGSQQTQHCNGNRRVGPRPNRSSPTARSWRSATDRPGHFWKAEVGHFSKAPKT